MPQIVLNSTNTVIHDGGTQSGSPTGSYSTNTSLSVGVNSGNKMRAYYRFELGLIPNNAVINSATLHLYNMSQSIMIDMWTIAQMWNEDTLSWNNAPILGYKIGTRNFPLYENNIDVTAVVREQLEGKNLGIALLLPDENAISATTTTIGASEHTTAIYRPTLTIDYSIPTEDKKQVEFVGSNKVTANAAAAANVPITWIVQPSDRLLAFVAYTDTYAASIDGWDKLSDEFAVSYNGWGRRLAIFSKVADGTETQCNVTFNGTVQHVTTVIGLRNAKNITLGPISPKITASTLYGPNDIANIPVNSFFMTVSVVPQDVAWTKPALNFAELVKGGYGDTGFYLQRTYNHAKTSYVSSEMEATSTQSWADASKAIIVEPITNEAPRIDGQDGDLGATAAPIQKAYTVADTEGDAVTIVEKLNGVTINTRSGAGTYTLDLSAQWENLSLGKHTITIEANDDYANPPHEPRVRTWTFTKLLAPNAKPKPIINGIGDVVTKFEGLKQLLVDKVGGDPTAKFEEIIAQIIDLANGSALATTTTKGFIYTDGSTTTSKYISVDTSILGFVPKHIVMWGTNKLDQHIYHWFDYDFYNNGTNYGNFKGNQTSVFRIPYIDGVLDLPVSGASPSYNWIAIGGA